VFATTSDGEYGRKEYGSGLLKGLHAFKSSFGKLPKEEMPKNVNLLPN
jgi:hypothetical protein